MNEYVQSNLGTAEFRGVVTGAPRCIQNVRTGTAYANFRVQIEGGDDMLVHVNGDIHTVNYLNDNLFRGAKIVFMAETIRFTPSSPDETVEPYECMNFKGLLDLNLDDCLDEIRACMEAERRTQIATAR